MTHHHHDHEYGRDHGHHSGHGHSHGVVDPSTATTAEGLWALKSSFAVLMATALLQAAIVFVSGSVGLLALHHLKYLSLVVIHVDPEEKSGERHHRIEMHSHDGLPAHSHP